MPDRQRAPQGRHFTEAQRAMDIRTGVRTYPPSPSFQAARRISGALHPVSLPRAIPIVMGAVTGPQIFSVHRDRAFRWRTFGFPITSPAPRGRLADSPALPADDPRPAQKRPLRLCRVHLLRACPGGSGSAPLKALPRPCRDERVPAHFPIGLSVQTGDTAPCHPHL